MKRQLLCLAALVATLATGAGNAIAAPVLTIYNQNLAVVRDHVALDLKQGENNVRFTDTTATTSATLACSSRSSARPARPCPRASSKPVIPSEAQRSRGIPWSLRAATHAEQAKTEL